MVVVVPTGGRKGDLGWGVGFEEILAQGWMIGDCNLGE